VDPRIYDIVTAPSAERLEADVRALAGFGTRNTFSDTLSDSRGIGAARRWIKAQFDEISADCGGCLEVFYQRSLVPASRRIPEDTWVVNVVAIQRGNRYPDRYVIMSGDIDSRASSGSDAVTDAPGANDNATGTAGAMEAARILTKYSFPTSIVYVALSGEEQGLLGGRHMAEVALEEGWDIVAVLNNDMIGNTEGIDGIKDNTTFRVFSEPNPYTDELGDYQRRRTMGGEVDGPSRQIARYVDRMADLYFPNLDAIMIYRLDRFGRGGHHRPFNDVGFTGVRIMETHENYNRQHQDIRVEGGIEYGDVVEWVDFDYVAKMTALNASVLAALAWAPPAPENVKLYWRDTTSPQWQWSRWVGDATEGTLENVIIDNFLFGVAAVGKDGNESPVVFPSGQLRRR
jgi:Zn-dependent M28 family amino/carboxypeptidase